MRKQIIKGGARMVVEITMIVVPKIAVKMRVKMVVMMEVVVGM